MTDDDAVRMRVVALERVLKMVVQMRAAQVAYFKTHGGLADCKKLERAVDGEIAIVMDDRARQRELL